MAVGVGARAEDHDHVGAAAVVRPAEGDHGGERGEQRERGDGGGREAPAGRRRDGGEGVEHHGEEPGEAEGGRQRKARVEAMERQQAPEAQGVDHRHEQGREDHQAGQEEATGAGRGSDPMREKNDGEEPAEGRGEGGREDAEVKEPEGGAEAGRAEVGEGVEEGERADEE